MKNIERVLAIIQQHPLGIDDDEISKETGIRPRQQVHQICSKLVAMGRVDRRSVEKEGKRRKIHNFPLTETESEPQRLSTAARSASASWERRLAKIEAATSRSRDEILEEALKDFALRILRDER